MKKKDKVEKVQQKKKSEFDNPAKSAPDIKRISKAKASKRKAEKKQRKSKRFGIELIVLQGLFTIAFLGGIFVVNLLPWKYLLPVVLVPILFFAIVYVMRKHAKGRAICCKILSVFLSLVLAIGTYCVIKINVALSSMTDAPYEATGESVDLLSTDLLASVSEDTFSIYIRDVNGAMDDDSKSHVNKIAVVSPETRQILMITIPNEYYVTIPGVSKGQKDTLANAGAYGEEASIAAINNLYETKISFYTKLDYEWLEEVKALSDSEFSLGMLERIYDIATNAGEHIQTSMTKEDVQELVRSQLDKNDSWEILKVDATGIVETNATYSEPKTETYVMSPNQTSVNMVIDLINRMEEGEKIKASDVE